MGDVRPWEHWRFEALVEAARVVTWGPGYAKSDGFKAYVRLRACNIPWTGPTAV